MENQAGVTQEAGMFDGMFWSETFERLASEVQNGCGLSYEYYVERFSQVVDDAVKKYPAEIQARAIEIAKEWDYMTIEEREAEQAWGAENGYCQHGIELGCCPAGCGSW